MFKKLSICLVLVLSMLANINNVYAELVVCNVYTYDLLTTLPISGVQVYSVHNPDYKVITNAQGKVSLNFETSGGIGFSKAGYLDVETLTRIENNVYFMETGLLPNGYARISGYVRNENNIGLQGIPVDIGGLICVTDNRGYFTTGYIIRTVKTLKISYSGYKKYESIIENTGYINRNLNIVLESDLGKIDMIIKDTLGNVLKDVLVSIN